MSKKIIVIKIGTNTVTLPDGQPDLDFMSSVAQQVETLRQNGFDVILVSSGAICIGANILNVPRPNSDNLELEQTCAAIGQIELILSWKNAFTNRKVSQFLVNHAVFNDEITKDNLKNSLIESLEMDIIPIINDNDSVSSSGIDSHFTDNDELAVEIARCVKASKLIILSDIHGLFEQNPQTNPNAKIIELVTKIDDNILKLAVHDKPFGGMKNKLLAIEKAMQNGIEVYLTYGKLENAILRAFEADFKGTRFVSNPES